MKKKKKKNKKKRVCIDLKRDMKLQQLLISSEICVIVCLTSEMYGTAQRNRDSVKGEKSNCDS